MQPEGQSTEIFPREKNNLNWEEFTKTGHVWKQKETTMGSYMAPMNQFWPEQATRSTTKGSPASYIQNSQRILEVRQKPGENAQEKESKIHGTYPENKVGPTIAWCS